MAITYLGDATFQQIEEASFGADLFGLDTLSRTYEGRSSLFPAFIRNFRRGQPDTEFPQLSFIGYSGGGSQGVIKVTLNFSGKYDTSNNARSDEERDTRLQQATFTGFSTGIQLNVTYKSPMVRTRWATLRRPKDSDGFQAEPDPDCEIDSVTGANQVQLASFGNTMEVILGSAEFNVVEKLSRTSFPRTQAGKWWRNTETVERTLVQESQTIIL